MKNKIKSKKVPFHYQDMQRYNYSKKFEKSSLMVRRIHSVGIDKNNLIFIDCKIGFRKGLDSEVVLTLSTSAWKILKQKVEYKLNKPKLNFQDGLKC